MSPAYAFLAHLIWLGRVNMSCLLVLYFDFLLALFIINKALFLNSVRLPFHAVALVKMCP